MLACPECRKLFPRDASECPEHRRALVPLESLPDADTPLEPGAMVGEYRVERRMGAGTFGAVYAGEQPLIGKRVAIKVLHAKFASDPAVVSRFVSEARAVNRIRHRNIIDIFSFGMLEEKRPYFVMELLEGMTLGELLDRSGRIPVGEALEILRGIAEGLDAAHEAGITHRDLKPDNIFLAVEKGGYFPKILDFGVAKLVIDDKGHKTATGAAIGTPSYMAPEQCRGKPVDHRADIYALGVVVHEMLTGKRLFQADSAMDVLLKHVSEPPQPMSAVCPELPRELDAPVLAMLAKSPRGRPDSAGAAIEALAERARASGTRGADSISVAPSSFARALAHREAATVVSEGTPRVVIVPTPSKEAPAALGTATPATPVPATPHDSGGPVVISLGDEGARAEPAVERRDSDPATPRVPGPATSPDGRFAISAKDGAIKVWDLRTGKAVHTFLGQPGAVDAALADSGPATPVREAPAGQARASQPAPLSAPAPAPRRRRLWAYVGAAAAVLAAVAYTQRGTGANPGQRPDAPAMAGRATLRLAVTPPDADVLVDGLRVGKVSEPLVLPRSTVRRMVRIEKAGFDPQTVWVTPDHDGDVPPVTLRASSPGGPAAP